MLKRLNQSYHAFPASFRVLVAAIFIDRLGGTILFPYFALYITRKFDVGMTQAGIVLGLFSVAGLVGSMAGGVLTDKIGRRSIIVFGLVSSALSSVAIGLTGDLTTLYGRRVVANAFRERCLTTRPFPL